MTTLESAEHKLYEAMIAEERTLAILNENLSQARSLVTRQRKFVKEAGEKWLAASEAKEKAKAVVNPNAGIKAAFPGGRWS